jgi:hypothetical protein
MFSWPGVIQPGDRGEQLCSSIDIVRMSSSSSPTISATAISAARLAHHPHAAPATAWRRRACAFTDFLFRRRSLHAQPRGAAHGPLPDSQRHVRAPTAGCSSKLQRRPATGGNHHRRGPEGRRATPPPTSANGISASMKGSRPLDRVSTTASACPTRTTWMAAPACPRAHRLAQSAADGWNVPLLRDGKVIEQPADQTTLTRSATPRRR